MMGRRATDSRRVYPLWCSPCRNREANESLSPGIRHISAGPRLSSPSHGCPPRNFTANFLRPGLTGCGWCTGSPLAIVNRTKTCFGDGVAAWWIERPRFGCRLQIEHTQRLDWATRLCVSAASHATTYPRNWWPWPSAQGSLAAFAVTHGFLRLRFVVCMKRGSGDPLRVSLPIACSSPRATGASQAGS